MTAHATFGRLFGYTALSVAGALAALTVSHGMAAAAPRAPLPSDDQAPAVPFDPGALVNAIDDYANLLSILTGGHRAQPGLGGPVGPVRQPVGAVGTVEQPSGAYPMLPGVPVLPGEP
ncbi:hypothetical protein B7435_09040 [Mycolicibacterium peregrinum]|uniref:hypothetical protein n=1 Tax=Mycolicibacterium peregrinum TaxID=43304 RepID=UPI0006D80DA6|nr:hypothetical protein [Mycolicibacterium peregrinum]MCV7202263.1 hypothetical protein [Mycolicibacterium peregrinum]ORW60408.1 hypothetical protein AWC21_10720 [Mycolicibacterium peregrinum]OWM05804.1 hypothetical protein B7435_09040 [Mycolicibacterium peregrinum]